MNIILPGDVWTLILSNVRIRDIFQARMTCKIIGQVTRSERFLKTWISKNNANISLKDITWNKFIGNIRQHMQTSIILCKLMLKINKCTIFGGFVRNYAVRDPEFHDIDIHVDQAYSVNLVLDMIHRKNYESMLVRRSTVRRYGGHSKYIVTHPGLLYPIALDITVSPGIHTLPIDFTVNALTLTSNGNLTFGSRIKGVSVETALEHCARREIHDVPNPVWNPGDMFTFKLIRTVKLEKIGYRLVHPVVSRPSIEQP
jgi:predicted nucleotidyltransferase